MPDPIAPRVHHIGIAVADLDAAEEIVRGRLGFPLVRREDAAETRGVRAAFFQAGNVEIELLWHADPEENRAWLGGAAQARVEHIALEVPDLEQAMEALTALGIELAPPRPGPIGDSARTVPETSGGITYQVLQFEDPQRAGT
ncbi:MAG: VOC family protein [Candidatus Dormibacteraeota bacterium]|nr:VOC family protein [Candidatus Dormibacteraeota bacterium]